MILKASQRAHGAELAAHLLNERDNEHIEVVELRGFVSEDVREAFEETQALSRLTRCKEYLFSVSLNPPPDAQVKVADFEDAAGRIEAKLGLEGQPRAMLLHEKNGRLHAHCVWSRIQVEERKAVHLPFFKSRLMEVARELYLEHGWQMPAGLQGRAPQANAYELPEYQQAKRTEQDPANLKETFREAWARSDSKAGFEAALLEQKLALARGDRRGLVAVDAGGEIYSLSRWCGVKTKELTARLGKPETLPDVTAAQKRLQAHEAARAKEQTQSRASEKPKSARQNEALKRLTDNRARMIERHRQARRDLVAMQRQRHIEETAVRQARFARGLSGLWQWVSGARSRIAAQNEAEAIAARHRTRAEREKMSHSQRHERRALEAQIKGFKQSLERDRVRLLERQRGPQTRERKRGPSRGRDGPSLH